ncbi:MAG: hypothetical protein HQ534_00525, partial [Armatimonadetes bacterium]|nr:hypothetical protein [Armatimonadota bacterium]
MKLKLFLLFVIICTNSWLQSTTWHIKQDGSGDFITIQEGIDASVDADTVLVYPGRYYENINYNGQNITVASLELITGDESYIGNTIIDGNQQGTCVCFDSEENGAILRGFSITNGIGDIMYGEINRLGGGILVFTHFQSLTINVYIINSRIYENRAVLGGGIFVDESNVTFSGVSIYNNYACSGGGISVVEESNITFDPSNLCNLYNNFAGLALDISVSDAINDIYVIVDTFSVQDQFEYFAFYQHSYTSSGNITINSQNHYIERINSDFYISTTGDDCNSGLTPEEPIRSIALALQKIESDSLNPKTVFVESGIYSYELNNQILPLAGKSFVNIIGENMETTIINNDLTAYTFMMVNKVQNSLRNFTLVSEEQCLEASIYILESNNIEIENLKVENSNIYLSGSVYFYRCFNVVIDNLIVQNNVSDGGSGFWFDGGNAIIRNSVFNNNDSNGLHPFVSNFYFKSNDYLELENCVFSNSNIEPTTEEFPTISIGAQQDCEPIIKLSNCLFSNNSTIKSYIAIITSSGSREINNCTFSENTSSFATLRIHSEVDFRNNIMYNNNVDYEILTGNITATGL